MGVWPGARSFGTLRPEKHLTRHRSGRNKTLDRTAFCLWCGPADADQPVRFAGAANHSGLGAQRRSTRTVGIGPRHEPFLCCLWNDRGHRWPRHWTDQDDPVQYRSDTDGAVRPGPGRSCIQPAIRDGDRRICRRRGNTRLHGVDLSGLRGQFLGGTLLGAVWSPCIGPTLGGAIALASQGESLLRSATIMIAFAAGVSTLIIGLGYGAGHLIRSEGLRTFAQRSKPLIGVLFIAVGVMILLRVHHIIEAWAVRSLPIWFQDLSVAL